MAWIESERRAGRTRIVSNLPYTVLRGAAVRRDIRPASATAVCEVHALPRMRISVIVPALNEEAAVEECLRSIEAAGTAETIVVDGGSSDETCTIAQRYAVVMRASRGRAVQMNSGAHRATGDVLLFLHADSRLPHDAFRAIRDALDDRHVVGGTFSLRFDRTHPLLRAYAWFTRLRPLMFHYGDQGIFVRRGVFEQLGGFAELPLMEDVDFLRRLSRAGRLALLPSSVTTSARRFTAHGLVRQQLLNAALVAAFHCGVSATRLARWYHGTRAAKVHAARGVVAERVE